MAEGAERVGRTIERERQRRGQPLVDGCWFPNTKFRGFRRRFDTSQFPELPGSPDGVATRPRTRLHYLWARKDRKDQTRNIQDAEAKIGAIAGLYQMFLEGDPSRIRDVPADDYELARRWTLWPRAGDESNEDQVVASRRSSGSSSLPTMSSVFEASALAICTDI